MATLVERTDADGNRIGWQAKIRKQGYPAKSKTFRTKAEAQAWAKSIETEMERGQWRDTSDSDRTTLGEAFQKYADEVTVTKKEQGSELAKIHQWQSRPLARISLSRIGGKEVAAAIKDMEAEGKSANTIRLHLAVLSHLYKIARTEWGMSNLSNPVELVRKPKLPQGRDRRLVGNEEARLLEACAQSRNPWLLPVVRFAIETAMRAGEIVETDDSVGLLWKHVDLSKRVAHLPETKNGSARDVPLSLAAVAVLKDLPRSVDGRVFPTNYNACVKLAYTRARERAGIKGLTFHDLRHEATSRLFEKGLNPMQVAAITGHKTLQMLKRYTHLKAEDLAKLLG